MNLRILPSLFVGVLVAGCVHDDHLGSSHRAIDDEASIRATTTRRVVVTRPQPTLRVERRIVSPNPNYVWIKGHWAWRNDDWVWVAGRWAERPRPGAVWKEGEFLQQGRRMVWTPGYWSNVW
jgi:hypothetical protein